MSQIHVSEFLEFHNLSLRCLDLLEVAFTHRSYTHENPNSPNNERLEYLGDSILGLVMSSYLYDTFPYFSEGKLTQYRSSLVCEESLARVSQDLQIGSYLRLGKGEEKMGGRERPSNIANCLEAVIAVFYIDQDFSSVQTHICNWFQKEIKNLYSISRDSEDPISSLQEMTQKYLHELPVYEELSQKGPAHRKEYVVRVLIGGKEYALGEGSSLKSARQQAASKAIRKGEKTKFGIST